MEADGDCGSAASRQTRLPPSFYVCCATHWISLLMSLQAETLIWNSHFAGDFAGQARVMGSVMSASAVCTFLVNPLLASWSDMSGRRPVMVLGAAASAAKFLLVGLRPVVSSLVVSNLLVVATVYSWLLGSFAAVGDVYGADSQALALAQSRLQLMQPLAGLVCPLIGAKLATVSVRIPYLLAAAAYFLQTLVTLRLPETLPKESRKPWSWSAASPLSVLQLFTRGAQLRVLAIMSLLNELSAGHSRQWMAITQTQRDELLGWTPLQRGQYNSFAGAATLPGFLGASRLIGWLGEKRTVAIGLLGYLGELGGSWAAGAQWHFFAAKPVGVLSYSAAVAISSRISIAAEAAGMCVTKLVSTY
jgi:DHA1 family tetracycline resistance protein-like MFS transporter